MGGGGRGFKTKKHTVTRVWIFSGTTQYNSPPSKHADTEDFDTKIVKGLKVNGPKHVGRVEAQVE